MESLSEPKKYVLKRATAAIVKSEGDYAIDYASELNEAQLSCVKIQDGPVLVIAGAGSGKTKTLIFRVARLIENGVNPENILLLTFTKKAASQMLSRASILLDSRCDKVAGGTFHSFANMILRKYSKFLELKNNFTIMDRADAEDVINHTRSRFLQSENKKDKRFPRKHTILDIYSKAINKNKSIPEIIEEEYSQFEHAKESIIEITQQYVEYKRTSSLLDYDDLLLYLKVLLSSNDDLRKQISNKYKYILVDEYQDTNSLQADIIRLLASEHNNVMAVGDDSQSIYSFRGANFRNIIDFPSIFEGTRLIKLEQNYRSSQNILALTNKIIDKAKEKYTKNLFSEIVSAERPALIASADSQTEAAFITQRVLELVEEDISLNEIAVLARSSRMTYDLEIELAKKSIPYRKFGGLKFIETAHVKDMIAYLRFVLNPGDVISLNRVLLLLQGIGAQTAAKLIPILSSESQDKTGLLPSGKSAAPVEDLIKMIEESRTLSAEPSATVKKVLDYYEPILNAKYDDAAKRQKDLAHFEYLASHYKTLDSFLSDLALEPPDKSIEDVNEGANNDEYLTISTIHSAKGLEYKTVFIIGAVDGRFPSVYSFNSDEELDEELRLMYVATTRAKTHLFITYPIDMFDHATGMVLSKPSRFFDGIDETILEPWIIES